MSDGSSTVGVVVQVPDPMGAEIAAIRATTGDLLANHIPTHITLLPPTTVSTERHTAFTRHLATVSTTHPTFSVHLSGTATFRPVSEVTFVVVSEGADQCSSLAAQVCAGPVRSPSPFDYHPHVTLAHGVAPPELDRVQYEQAGISASFRVAEICLYERTSVTPWHLQSRFSLQG